MTEESKYAALSLEAKWRWHAGIYAFRHVQLGKPLNEPSPCDEKGIWYSEPLALEAVHGLLEKRAAAARTRKERAFNDPATQVNERRYREADAWRAAGGMSQPQGTMSPAAALGVTAREYTPEELAKARTELGMEE